MGTRGSLRAQIQNNCAFEVTQPTAVVIDTAHRTLEHAWRPCTTPFGAPALSLIFTAGYLHHLARPARRGNQGKTIAYVEALIAAQRTVLVRTQSGIFVART